MSISLSTTHHRSVISSPVKFVLPCSVELSCGAIVCFHCCSNWVMHCTSARLPTPCPCCYDHPLDSTTVRPPPQLIISLLSGMLLSCERKCGNKVRADQYEKHLQGRCQSQYQYSAHSPSKVTPERCPRQTSHTASYTSRDEVCTASRTQDSRHT